MEEKSGNSGINPSSIVVVEVEWCWTLYSALYLKLHYTLVLMISPTMHSPHFSTQV